MAWSDEPTDAQIGMLYHLIQWKMPTAEAIRAVDWLREHSTRRDVSYELKRIRELYIAHRLTKDKVFESEVWDGYERD